jgi:hypothetical protein
MKEPKLPCVTDFIPSIHSVAVGQLPQWRLPNKKVLDKSYAVRFLDIIPRHHCIPGWTGLRVAYALSRRTFGSPLDSEEIQANNI